MAEEQFGEDLRFDFALGRFFQTLRVAGLIGAIGIDLRGEEQHVAMGGPGDAVGFRREGSERPGIAAIQGQNPHLRVARRGWK